MTSCTIIVSHFESLPFLRACVRQVRKYKHPDIEQKIIIADQSSKDYHALVADEFGFSDDIQIVWMKSLYSGYGIDYVMRYVPVYTEYVCQIHVDAMPIHKNWLWLPIQMIAEKNFVFVGQMQFYSQPSDGIYYLNKMFFSMSACFNIAPTFHYHELSMYGGFTRFHNRPLVDVPMFWINDDWNRWAGEDYANRGSDDDVIAFCWEDNHRVHNKLGLAITGMIEQRFGRVIEDMVFHFGSCRESIAVKEHMSEAYNAWTERINAGFDEKLLDEMLLQVKPSDVFKRMVWDGKTKSAWPALTEINDRIQELKTS